jgi:hypothetical protein
MIAKLYEGKYKDRIVFYILVPQDSDIGILFEDTAILSLIQENITLEGSEQRINHGSHVIIIDCEKAIEDLNNEEYYQTGFRFRRKDLEF